MLSSNEYRTIHQWVQYHYGKPNNCEDCGNTKLMHRQYHWANVSGEYRKDITDWKRLCASCHKKFDYRLMCRKGHLRTSDNTKIESNGHRRCITCRHNARRIARLSKGMNNNCKICSSEFAPFSRSKIFCSDCREKYGWKIYNRLEEIT